MYQSMVIVRSGSTTDCITMNDQDKMDPDHFILCLCAALKSPDIKGQLKQIIQTSRQECADLISSEIHKQLKPLQEELETKNKEIWALKITIMEQNTKLDQLEQHGRRDSLRISGIPENVKNDDTDTAVLTFHAAMKVDPRFNHKKLPYHIELARLPQESHDRFSLNVPAVTSERKSLRPRKTLKLNASNTSLTNVYMNEDRTHFRVNLAQKIRNW